MWLLILRKLQITYKTRTSAYWARNVFFPSKGAKVFQQIWHFCEFREIPKLEKASISILDQYVFCRPLYLKIQKTTTTLHLFSLIDKWSYLEPARTATWGSQSCPRSCPDYPAQTARSIPPPRRSLCTGRLCMHWELNNCKFCAFKIRRDREKLRDGGQDKGRHLAFERSQ